MIAEAFFPSSVMVSSSCITPPTPPHPIPFAELLGVEGCLFCPGVPMVTTGPLLLSVLFVSWLWFHHKLGVSYRCKFCVSMQDFCDVRVRVLCIFFYPLHITLPHICTPLRYVYNCTFLCMPVVSSSRMLFFFGLLRFSACFTIMSLLGCTEALEAIYWGGMISCWELVSCTLYTWGGSYKTVCSVREGCLQAPVKPPASHSP